MFRVPLIGSVFQDSANLDFGCRGSIPVYQLITLFKGKLCKFFFLFSGWYILPIDFGIQFHLVQHKIQLDTKVYSLHPIQDVCCFALHTLRYRERKRTRTNIIRLIIHVC